MTEPTTPRPDPTAQDVTHHHMTVEFDILASTWLEASDYLARALLDTLAPDEPDVAGDGPTRPRVREANVPKVQNWILAPTPRPAPDRSAGREWLEESRILDVLAEMFPPEPSTEAFTRADGSLDLDELERARRQWSDQCATLAVQAAQLPELLERLERTEGLRDDLVDVLERFPLPVKPNRDDYLVTSTPAYDGEIDVAPYAWDLRSWRARFDDAVEQREHALRALVAGAGTRSPYLPARFAREWVPADLLAIQVLRAVAQPGRTVSAAGLLNSQQSYELAAILATSDPVVSVPDPDDPTAMPIYEGRASQAHELLISGLYEATGLDGTGQYRLVVAHAPVGDTTTASAAFSVSEHDTATLDKIAALLRQLDTGTRADRVLTAINQVVADTGRDGADLDTLTGAPTLLQRGVTMRDLLTRREHDITPGEPGPREGGRPGPDRHL